MLNDVGNRTLITETLLAPNTVANAYLESEGLVAMEAEHYSETISSTTHAWLTDTAATPAPPTSRLWVLIDAAKNPIRRNQFTE